MCVEDEEQHEKYFFFVDENWTKSHSSYISTLVM